LNRKRIPTQLGVLLLAFLEIVGLALLYLSSLVGQSILQAIAFIISVAIIWYALHPLAHYIVAMFCKVRTLFFYIGRSELRKCTSPSIVKKFAPLLITVGTKLNQDELKLATKSKRAWIYGSGALFGIVVIALIESYALLDFRYNIISLLLGGLFFLFTLLTEITLSTQSGDLSKMRKEIAK
jgi:hypothetical protein